MSIGHLSSDEVAVLAGEAWRVRDQARILGETAVGCAALDESGLVTVGCNVEHRFRSHDIHAETNALSSFVAAGGRRLKAILIAADRDRFTPCGACLDWVFELGGEECVVAVQRSPESPVETYLARELMPFYPM